MNFAIDRETIAQVVIILALCLGGWMMIVEGRIDELAELGATIAEATANPLLEQEGTLDEMVGQLDGVRGRLHRIEKMNGFARDSSRMYSLIMDLAEEHGVVVQRLDPGSGPRRSEAEETAVSVTTFDMTVTGGYEQIASFLDAVASLTGFVRPVALTLTPRQDDSGERVEARFACEAVSFALPDALAVMLGGSDADG